MATRSDFDFGMDEVLQVSQSSSQSSVIDEEEMVRMEQEATPESTSRATKSGMNKFLSWKIKREIDINFHSITATSLALILRRFYAEVKKENGKPLTPSSLVGIRAALNRYLVGAPFYRKMNVVSGPEFVIANKMFDTKCKLYYKANNPKPRHKPVIEKEDMKKLGAYFKNYYQNPVILTETVWFLLCFHFGRRGREGWAEMRKDFFTITTKDGSEVVECSKTEAIKNIQGGHKQSDQDYRENEMRGEAVQIFKFFLSKLNPKCDRMFQYPLNSFLVSSDVWFANKPIGKNTLSQMMQRISEKSGLSMRYTCHSVRASCISTLFQAGVSVEKIVSITGHKNVSSLKHYISGMSSAQKEECSSILSSSVFDHHESAITITPSVVVPQENSIVVAPTVVPTVAPAVASSGPSSGAVSSWKYSEIFGTCTFNNCEIKFS